MLTHTVVIFRLHNWKDGIPILSGNAYCLDSIVWQLKKKNSFLYKKETNTGTLK